ncbi:transcriptional regulator [Nocardioides baekrokdamisoli]|uniref:Transcriptional regulator n=1 Tax=Nocardioides baekrokdamisoli TaxID=1804624 RepID=A0A3G9ICF7_9ACTN|nr:helix-turn-helix domain-containing protein [Nocardioides baekrokdamisoli]BBH16617.1 transcriptional regulator [Nocardioides baekrokdamisoli]
MDSRLVELSRSVDPVVLGKRLRLARLGAGLTQEAVVASEVSAAYLSRIEAGHRRPEFALLTRMAQRIGISLEDLLVDPVNEDEQRLRVALDHAELQLVSGDAAAALTSITEVIAGLGEAPALAPAAAFVRARALEGVGDYNEAILVLEDLTAEASVDPAWLRASIALCRCYRQAGDAAASIEFGERASAAARDLGLEGSTEAIQLSVTVAWAYATLGDNDRALRMCLRALETADRHGSSPVARGSAYWNASIIQGRRGKYAAAADFSRKALAIFEEADDMRALAAVRSEAADLHLSMDPPDPVAALEMLDRAEQEMDWSAGSVSGRSALLVTRARAHLMAGDTADASAALERAESGLPEADVVVRAYAASLAGQIAAAEGRTEDAASAYREAVRLLSELGADHRVSRLWYELGDLLAEAGHHQAAVDAFRAGAVAAGALPARRATFVRRATRTF